MTTRRIKWDRELRQHLQRGRPAEYTEHKVRDTLYRPFTKSNLFFDRVLNNCVYLFPSIFPTPETETENRVICLTDKGSEKPFMVLMGDQLADLHVVGPGCSSQCFPFYTYDENGTNRQENITDWALTEFRAHYQDDTISKWDIFHYTYALLHHPTYREKYEMNLKRDLPRIPIPLADNPLGPPLSGGLHRTFGVLLKPVRNWQTFTSTTNPVRNITD